jgi:BRCT domain type II-containing protein
VGVEVFDLDLAAASAKALSCEFHKSACPVTSASTTESDRFRASGQQRVLDKVVDELPSSDGVEDYILNAGVEPVEIEDVLSAVGSRRNWPSFGVGGQVQVAERDEA